MTLEEKAAMVQMRGIFPVPIKFDSNKILVIGDVHGYTKTYQKFIRKLHPEQRTYQIGDMGMGFAGVGLHEMSSNHKWFRGNHDNPAQCYPNKNYAGDFGYDPTTGIFHIAGAFSIDRAWRIEGKTWWADEELGYTQLSLALDLYERVKPRFVLSHEAPSKTSEVLLYNLMGPYFIAKQGCISSRTDQALQSMLDIHQPEKWIFGHYHVDKQFTVPNYNTQFICVGGMMSDGEVPHTYELEIS